MSSPPYRGMSIGTPLRRAARTLRAAVAALTVTVAATAAVSGSAFARAQPAVHQLGPLGTAAIHGDISSTDTIPGRGPAPRQAPDHHEIALPVRSGIPGATCSSAFSGSDGMITALCTSYLGFDPARPLSGLTPLAPMVVLFDPHTAAPLASLQLPKGSLLGGVYGYLDNHNRVVVADGNGALHAVSYAPNPNGSWHMSDHILADLSSLIPDGDPVAGLLADNTGRIWFATHSAAVGTVIPDQPGSARIISLPAHGGVPGEHITNGLTVRPGGASIATTHALYEVSLQPDGTPAVQWRRAYDRGTSRHPGMLAWGTGSTPTYFTVNGRRLVAIVDSAARSDLLVYDVSSGNLHCRMPAFATTERPESVAADGVLITGPAQSENSPIAISGPAPDTTGLIFANTYGFQYFPAAPEGPAEVPFAPYYGGATRIDVTASGCSRAWTNLARTATLPKVTTGDRLIHSLAYGPTMELSAGLPAALRAQVQEQIDRLTAAGLAQKFGPVYYSAIDADTGVEVARSFVGVAPLDEPMELTGTVAPADGSIAGQRDVPGVMWQPTMGQMLRIGPA